MLYYNSNKKAVNMSARKKLVKPVTLFAQVEDAQYLAIRGIAVREKKSIAVSISQLYFSPPFQL